MYSGEAKGIEIIMKNVLIWGMTANWGGIESVLFNYVVNSNRNEIRFDFITTFKSIPRSEVLKSCGCKIYHICDRRSNYMKYRMEMNTFFKMHAKEYDAIWLNDCMFANIDSLKLAKKYGIRKRIVHAHNSSNLGGGKSRIIRHKFNLLLLPKYATDYWACSQLAGEWTFPKKILESSHYMVINNAIDCEKYSYNILKRKQSRDSLNISDNTFVIGHVGRFDYQKNHMYLLEIMNKLCDEIDNVILLSIGTGSDYEKIKNKASEMKLDKRILFLGQRSDVAELFQAMDLFVLPSKFEGLPVVLVEAMASGLPCIVSDNITKESQIIPELCKFDSIDGNIETWVMDIKKAMKYKNRRDTINEMREAGYDIKRQALSFHELF